MGILESSTAKVFGMKWILIGSFFLWLGCTPMENSVPYYFTPDLSPTWNLTSFEGEKHSIGAFSLLNQNGEKFTEDSIRGKVTVANFFFTSCPSICPTMTENLKAVQDKFSSDVQLISFSVTPEIDSVEKLKEYHSGRGLNSNWTLLTGNQADIYELSRESFFVEEEIGFSKDSSDFLHTERCVLVDQKGYIRGVFNATLPLDIQRMMDDIDILLKED